MSQSPSSIWLRGLSRLMRVQAGHAKKAARASVDHALELAKTSAPASSPQPRAASAKAAATAAPLAQPHAESRVGPRAAAWARGTWTKSFFSAPPVLGDLVNHLSYGLYLPADRGSAPLPLVVMLHGCKQNVEAFAQGTRMNLLADQYGFAVLYPEQSNHAHPHRCWRWYNASPQAGGAEAEAIAALVRAMVAEHDLDASRVYVAGLSAGAGMATLLALRYPELFAAVGVHSGVVFGAAHSAIDGMDAMRRGTPGDLLGLVAAAVDLPRYPGMPALLLHGEQDKVVAPLNLDQLERQFAHLNGLIDADGRLRKEASTKEIQGAAGEHWRDYFRRGRQVLRVCRVPDLPHAWSGGDDALPFHSAKGPQASALLWEFFKDQHRPSQESAKGGALAPATSAVGAL